MPGSETARGSAPWRLQGAVLAGGESRRMGRDKALVEIDGRPMASIVASAFAAVGCDPVLLVGGDESSLRSLGLSCIADIEPGTGPLGGVVSALEWSASSSGADGWMLVGPCDLAMLDAEALGPLMAAARLIDASERIGSGGPVVDVVVARTDRLEPALAVWRVAAHRVVRRLHDAGTRSLHGAIVALEHAEVAVNPAAMRNINTPADLPGYPGRS